jgi:predicted transposase YbfD/YdcC
MNEFPVGSLLAHFAELNDPCVERTKKHKLIDMLAIAICGVICEADNWVDGKNLRHSYDKHAGKAALWLVNAWASQAQIALGQVAVAEKSTEITAIPALLKLLALKGCIVTLDAIGCRTEIAQLLVDRDADYILAVKANQPMLYEDITELFGGVQEVQFQDVAHSYVQSLDKHHGRVQRRRCWALSKPALLNYLRHQAE